MCYDLVNQEALSCGCIILTYEHDSFPSQKKVTSYCKDCKQKLNIESERQNKIYEERMNDVRKRLNEFNEVSQLVTYEKIPIKYFKNKYSGINSCCFKLTINRDSEIVQKLKIEKIKNRYYCCKNRVDKFVELNLHIDCKIDI